MAQDWQDRERWGRGAYGSRDDYSRGDRSRDWSDRAGDEVRSWFRDDNAERRRRRVEARGYGRESWRSGPQERGFLERAGDEIASWFGDADAQRRREMDAGHRGRGPRNYTRSDERIREDVSDRLADDPHIDASDIEVSVSGGEVTLDGTVDRRFAKRHAEDLAESCSGVTHVQNNLRVRDRQSDFSRSSTTGSSTGMSGV